MIETQKRSKEGVSSDLLGRFVASSEASFAALLFLLVVVLAYRLGLAIGLYTSPVRPFDFRPTLSPWWFIASHFPSDLAFVLGSCFICWAVSRLVHGRMPGVYLRTVRISGLVLLQMVLAALAFIHVTHLRLLFEAQTGFDFSVLQEAYYNISFRQILAFVELKDVMFFLSPIGLLWLVLLSPMRWKVWAAKITLLFVVFLTVLTILSMREKDPGARREIRLNPVLFFLSDFAENAFPNRVRGARTTQQGYQARWGIQRSPAYAHSISLPRELSTKSSHPWNIVFFIMESAGTRYLFDTSSGRPMPMPFLHQLTKESWYLEKHYTTSNVSTKATFSLLSGLYDFFNRESFGLRSDTNVPCLNNFLGDDYESFLVTPSSKGWYFPAAFLQNSGLKEIHTYEDLSFRIREDQTSLGRYIARDEIQTVDFFIQRLKRAREPFVGIYISFVAHYPYFDYGPEYRVAENLDCLISRYYNNLRLLDYLIHRVFRHLKEQGQLDRTILVIVGDHGQAFGQHAADNFLHYRYSYNENLETPALLYQPALFRPRRFEFPTSHIDLLPTLLDALRVPYDPSLFDGESLFQNRLTRKSIYFYGLEGCVSALSTDWMKVQYSFKQNKCWVFDLKVDPEERLPLDCSLYSDKGEELRDFVRFHDWNLLAYNNYLKERRRSQGFGPPNS